MKKLTLKLLAMSLMLFGAIGMSAQISSFPYLEDFETDDGGWSVYSTQGVSQWEHGVPNNGSQTAANSGTQCFATNLTGDYTVNQDGVMQQRFDFTAVSSFPKLRFAMHHNTEGGFDGVNVMVSTDSVTFTTLGTTGDANWYNDNDVSGLDNEPGWSGDNGGFVSHEFDLSPFSGEDTLYIQFRFGSDISVVDDGILIDDIEVFEITCPSVDGMAFSAITDSSATVDWTVDPAIATTYTVDVTQGGGSISGYPLAGQAGFSHAIPDGLTAGLEYSVTITPDCGGGIPFSANFFTLNCSPTLQCDYTLELFDFGDGTANSADGWPADAFVTVTTGNQVSTYTIAPGTYDPPLTSANDAYLVVNVKACPGEVISVFYSGSTGDEEDEFRISGPGGFSFQGATIDGTGTSAVACPTCATPSVVTASNICEDAVDLTWVNGAAYDSVAVQLVWGPPVPVLRHVADTMLVGNITSLTWANIIGNSIVFGPGSPGLNTAVAVNVTGYCTPALPADPVESSSAAGAYTGPECSCADQCYYALEGCDDFGDGWNGHEFKIVLDGDTVNTFTVDDPVGATDNCAEGYIIRDTVYTCPGQVLEIYHVDGDFDGEVTFSVTGSTEGLLYETNDGVNAGDRTTAGVKHTSNTCPSCLAATSLGVINIGIDTAQVVWTNDNPTDSTSVIVVPSGNAASSGTGALALDTNYTAMGLTSNTAYDVYIVNLCVLGPADTVGPVGFVTLPDYCAGDGFVDSGGPAADYPSGSLVTTTICPDNPGTDVVQVTFSEFSFENSTATCFDGLRIYNGNSDAALPITPLTLGIGSSADAVEGFCWDRDDVTPNGTGDLLGITVISSDATGCLTFTEYSDGGGNREGFQAAVVCAPAPTCFAPSAITVDNPTQSTLDVSWTDSNAPSQGFELEYVLTGDAQTGANVLTVAGTDTTINMLSAETTYDVYLRAICSPGDTSLWSVVAVSGTTSEACQAPFGLVVSNVGADTATYTWNDGDLEGATSFSYEVTLNGVAQDGTDVTTGVADTTDMDSGLMPETAYDVYVWADCGIDGASDTIGPVTFTTTATCPPVTDGVAMNVTTSGADLAWTDGAGSAMDYLLVLDTAGDGYDVANEVLTGGNPYAVSGLTSNFSYEFYVRQICAVGDTSVLAGPFTFTTAADYCGADNYTDPGGAGDYPINAQDTVVICPDTPGDLVTLTFLSFGTEACCDDLTLYDGPDTGSPVIGTFAGTTLPGTIVATVANGGCITGVFSSDFSVVGSGFEATVTCAPPPSCFAPTAFAASNVTNATADLSWTDSNSPSVNGFSLAVNTSGTGLPLAWDSVGAVSPVAISGLTGGTTYDAYIIADCDGDGISDTVSTSFTTALDPPAVPNGVACGAASAFVFAEEFDAVGAWTGDIETGDGSWQFPHTGTTPSNFSDNPGPSGAHSGSNYTFYEASGGTTANAVMTSGLIDLTSATVGADQIELSFYFHANGNVGQFDLAITDDLGVTNDTVFTWDAQFHTADTDPWTPVGIDISSYAGSTIQLEMRHQGINDFTGDFAVDFLRIEACGSFCPDPSGLAATPGVTDANLTWSENGSATTWALEVVTSGSPATGVGFLSSGTPDTLISGLMPGTSYDAYVRAICGVGDSSAWVGPITFTTNPDFCGGATYTDPGGNAANYPNGVTETITICPDNPGDLVTLTFTSFGTEACCDDLTLYDGPTTGSPLIGTFAGTTSPGTIEATVANGGCITGVWSADGSVNDIGFEATVTCSPPPACVDPSGLTCEFQGVDSIAVSWTGDATSVSYDIEYGLTGFTPDSLPEANQTGTTFSLNGLPSNTAYDFYVLSLCGGDSSEWVGPITCSTTPDFCGGDQFIDSGGDPGNYPSGVVETTVICPDNTGDIVVVDFTTFVLEDSFSGCFDGLDIYDGPSDASPQITPASLGIGAGTGQFCWDVTSGTGDLVGQPIASSLANGGCLTFVFTSDGSVSREGWVADVSCILPPDCWQPTDLAVSAIGGDSAIVAWSANPLQSGTFLNDTVFVMNAGEVPGVDTPVATYGSAVSPLEIDGLTNDTDYDVYVQTECAEGFSLATGPESFTTDPTCFPAENITVDQIGSDTAVVAWTAGAEQVLPVSGYGMEVYPAGADTTVTAATYSASGVTSPHTASGLTENTSYDVYITTDCGGGDVAAAAGPTTFLTQASCLAPLGVTPFGITATGASISWTAANAPAAPSYDVYIVAAGADTTGGLVGDDVTAPYVASGLMPATSYDVYVIANCAGGGSPLSGAGSFTTLIQGPSGITCTTGSPTLLINEEFDEVGGWTGDTGTGGTNGVWNFGQSGGTGSSGTGPTGAESGTFYAYFETSLFAPGNAVALSPAIDLTPAVMADGVELAFYLHAVGAEIGQFDMSVTTDGGVTADTVFTYAGQLQGAQADPFVHVGVDLSAYAGQVIQLQMHGDYTASGFAGDIAVDLLTVEACGDFCVDLAALTCGTSGTDSIQISWTGDANHVDYDVLVYDAGADTSAVAALSSTTGVVGTSHTEFGLSSLTSYDFYVRANCASATLDYVGPLTCTTLADFCAGDQFIDTGGPAGNYSNNELTTTVICPDNVGTDVVQISFSEFATEGCCDDLTLYDGPDDTFPVIAVLAGSEPGLTYSGSLANGGCITAVFDSDFSVNQGGWVADVACVDATPPAETTCAGAAVLPVGSGNTCTSGTTFDMTFADASLVPTSPQCFQATDPRDVWFKVEIPASGKVVIDFPSMPGNGMFTELFTGSDCSLTYLDLSCNAVHPKAYPARGVTAANALTPGDTLYIRVWEAGNDELGEFEICVNDPRPTNDECASAVPVPVTDFGVGSWTTSRSDFAYGETSSCGVGEESVWFSFVATDANQAINARQIGGSDYDPVIEVYDACGGTSLGCFNNYGAGAVERALITGLTAGNTYFYTVSHAGLAGSASADDFQTGIRGFNDGSLDPAYCGVLDYTLDQAVYSLRDDQGDLYSNPNVPVKAYGFRFQETSDGSTPNGNLDVSVQNANNVPYVQLDDVPGLEYGKQYLVSTQHRVKLGANGTVDEYWSDFQAECLIGLQATVPTTMLKAEFCPAPDLYLEQQIQAVPVLGATQYRFRFNGGGDTFVEPSGNYSVFLYNVGTPGNGLQYATVYTVDVDVFVNGAWSGYGPACTVPMQTQPEASAVQAAYCGGTYEYPQNPNYILAEPVLGATYYEWRVTPVGGGVAQTATTTGISLQMHTTTLDFSAGGDWDVEVRAFAGGVLGDYGSSCSITINATGSMAPPAGDDTAEVKLIETSTASASIYPNPSAGEQVFITITDLVDVNQKITVEVVDVSGKTVHSTQLVNKGVEANFVVDFDEPLSKGMYFVNMYVNDTKLVEKLTVK